MTRDLTVQRTGPEVVGAPGRVDRPSRDAALAAAGVGVFDWDLLSGRLSGDDRMLELFGFTRESFTGAIDAVHARLHPADLARIIQIWTDAIETRGEYQVECRVIQPDGRIRWIAARGQVLGDDAGRPARLIGAGFDTTAHRTGDARVAQVLDTMPAAFLTFDDQWRFVHLNAEAENLLGFSRGELLGQVIWDRFPAARGSDIEVNCRRAMAERQPMIFEAHYPHPLGAWYEVRVWPTPEGLSVYVLNITERKAVQEQTARAAARAALIAEVDGQLSETLDAEEAVGRLARLMVPRLADWCLITLVEDDGPRPDWRRGLRDLGWAHADPDQVALVAGYAFSRLGSLRDNSPLATALRRGRPVLIEQDAVERLSGALAPGPAQEFIRRLDPGSAVVIPLRGRGRTVGLLTLYNARDRPPLCRQDLDTALDAAARAGLALDNVRLYAQQRLLAEELQRSLLTDPPEPDHLEVAVRYEPAAEAAQVGGDWYDAFLQPDGDTMLVIGDVVGHDTAAAAAMGQIRSLLRGIAAHTGDGPAEVLRGVDRVMRTLQIQTTATAVVARLEPPPDRADAGPTRLRWSNAGHPPPAVIAPDGAVTLLPGQMADLLLGVDPGSPRGEHTITLDRGSTVLLYTDGLVERRDQPLAVGLDRLRDVLAELAELPLDALCDRLLHELLPTDRDDDVALVAVRLRRQEQPATS